MMHLVYLWPILKTYVVVSYSGHAIDSLALVEIIDLAVCSSLDPMQLSSRCPFFPVFSINPDYAVPAAVSLSCSS